METIHFLMDLNFLILITHLNKAEARKIDQVRWFIYNEKKLILYVILSYMYINFAILLLMVIEVTRSIPIKLTKMNVLRSRERMICFCPYIIYSIILLKNELLINWTSIKSIKCMVQIPVSFFYVMYIHWNIWIFVLYLKCHVK